ncbi:hypothetical protein FDJ47_gp49 [Enterobacter phage Ec_L1]|uniref:Uncharacterized protein n=1 Tax=Enterobacter phage Ec_L1 TaxID=2070180 RepID=A0A2P0WA01_9CAUD|nr:hypothetical protein FDJ47_gp49 [Enterobacter phage Ec_L1]AUV57163.1 hypothetical protein Ec49 [Enterobacter phage Ec_L1]
MKEKYMRATSVSFVAPYTMNGFTAGKRYFSNEGAYIWQRENGDVYGISRTGVTDDDGQDRVVCLVETSIFNGETLVARIEHEYDENAVIRKRNRYRHMVINAFAMYARRWWNMSKKQARAWGRMHAEPFFYNDGSLVEDTIVSDYVDSAKLWEVDQELFNDAVYEEMSCW